MLSVENSIERGGDSHKRTLSQQQLKVAGMDRLRRPQVAYRVRRPGNALSGGLQIVQHPGSQQTENTHESLSPHSLAIKLSEYELAAAKEQESQPTLKALITEASKKKERKEAEARRTHAGSKMGNAKRFTYVENALSEQ